MNTLELLRSGQLVGATRLQIACGLTEFPREIFDLADSLEILDLSGNALRALPDDFARLHKLRILFCSNNAFTELPPVLGQCPHLSMVGFKANRIRTVPGNALPHQLRWLILTDNQLQSLPTEIGQCTQLQKLMLAGNQLQDLPISLAACRHLELLRIAANQLTAFPDVVLALPRLSWLAYSGNPFCSHLETVAMAQTPVPAIAWQHLRLGEKLGEGASGNIHHAHWQSADGDHSVAVKLFKGAVTSDGLPQCEMAACLRAGAHSHLIPVRGKVVEHPQAVQALVMSLIPPHLSNLAGPPSLDSCTRDVYSASTVFRISTALGIALAIASAVSHLHTQGVLHGDLYAHNILCDASDAALLGDFGAASFLDPANHIQTLALQRLEVRAYGCLLEELLERCPGMMQMPQVNDVLQTLKTACLANDAAARPLMQDVRRELGALSALTLDC